MARVGPGEVVILMILQVVMWCYHDITLSMKHALYLEDFRYANVEQYKI